jgi:hypothetical protein
MAISVVGLPNWLEQAIGSNRNASAVAQAIGQHPEFLKLVQDAIGWAANNPVQGVDGSRLIAEDIAVRLHRMFTDFKTMHN